MGYGLVRFTSSLVPKNIVQNSEKWSQRFRLMAEILCATKKITLSIAGDSKFQYDEFLEIVIQIHDEFISSDFHQVCLGMFLGKYLSDRQLCYVCKLIFVLSHGQSFIKRGFSVNKELMGTNMKENLSSQRFIYNKILSEDSKISAFWISPELRRYKQDLEKQKKEQIAVTQSLTWKLKREELENLKRKKKDLETTMNYLKEEFEKETFKAEENQDLLAVSKAAAFLRAVKEKKTLAELCNAEEYIEKDLEQIWPHAIELTCYVIKTLVYW